MLVDLQAALTLGQQGIAMPRRRHQAPPAMPPSPPCLVLGPDGQTLALATKTKPKPQPRGREPSPLHLTQPTIYTAYLNVDDSDSAPVDLVARQQQTDC